MKKFFKNINLKSLIKSITLILGLGLIVILTVVQVGLDPEKLDFYKWLSDTCILVGIMIFGLFMGETIGFDKQKEKVGGLYQNSLKEYNEKIKFLQPLLCFFSQFYRWFKNRELFDKKVNYLINNDIDSEEVETIVKYVRMEHLEDLSQHAIKITDTNNEEHFINKQTQEQIDAIKAVLNGAVKIDSPNPSYFLSGLEHSSNESELERGKRIDKEIKINKTANRIIKIISSIIISLIWATLTVKEFMDGSDPQAWLNLVSRITGLFTALYSGWLTSVIDIKLRASKLKNKTNVLSSFESAISMKQFIPQSANDEARKQFEEYVEANKKLAPQVEEKPIQTNEENGGNENG